MSGPSVDRWFTQFQVEESTDLESSIVWTEGGAVPRPTRQSTRSEKLSILMIGIGAIGFIVLMAITIIAAVYISRH